MSKTWRYFELQSSYNVGMEINKFLTEIKAIEWDIVEYKLSDLMVSGRPMRYVLLKYTTALNNQDHARKVHELANKYYLVSH